MICENAFCIYWNQHHCILDEIELDETGTCRTCILVSLEESILENARLTSLAKEKKHS